MEDKAGDLTRNSCQSISPLPLLVAGFASGSVALSPCRYVPALPHGVFHRPTQLHCLTAMPDQQCMSRKHMPHVVFVLSGAASTDGVPCGVVTAAIPFSRPGCW